MPLASVVPEFAPLLAALRDVGAATPEKARTAEIRIGPPSNRRTLLARIGVELQADGGGAAAREVVGYVLTFDDITELLSAQRKAAWADVARRIAHEIKNPLTPIQLSAERLKRKLPQGDPVRSRTPSRPAPTPSCARSATSAAWWTSSPPSPACRSR